MRHFRASQECSPGLPHHPIVGHLPLHFCNSEKLKLSTVQGTRWEAQPGQCPAWEPECLALLWSATLLSCQRVEKHEKELSDPTSALGGWTLLPWNSSRYRQLFCRVRASRRDCMMLVVHESARSNFTEDHRPGGLSDRHLSSHLWRLGCPDQGAVGLLSQEASLLGLLV